MHNFALREEPREQRAAVISSKHESSLLAWLQASGRLISRDNNQEPEFLLEDDSDLEQIIESDDSSYDGLDDEDDEELGDVA